MRMKFLYYVRKAIMILGLLVSVPSLVPKVEQGGRVNKTESRDNAEVVVLRGVVYHSEICIQCRSWAALVGGGNLRVNRSAGRVSEVTVWAVRVRKARSRCRIRIAIKFEFSFVRVGKGAGSRWEELRRQHGCGSSPADRGESE